ncbi:transposable element Tcb1 transposase [Trichonephila clavipes]|uniref:Transposable element Tcb1 transposase n=1 Tax=Trichonephila clavipes TaxID=2585209 RepID=A0A8X6T0E1_TRICX|nr:transposable element Tcb1 transposase [Trichonephila clavipes]
MGTEFVFMDNNTRSHIVNIVKEYLQSEDITRMDWPAFPPDLNPVELVWWHAWPTSCSPSTTSHMSIGTSESIS